MDPMTIAMLAAAGVQTAQGIGQTISSAIKRRKAKREFDPYQIPASARASLEKASSLATMRGIPGEDLTRSRAMSSVARGTEVARRTAESPSDVLAVLGRLHGDSYMGFEQNMAMQGANAYERRQQGLMGALNRFAGYETEKWQYTELYPYMQAMGEAGQIDAAGSQNIASSMNLGMTAMGGQMDINQQRSMFDQWKQWQMGQMGQTPMATAPAYNSPYSTVPASEPTPPQFYNTWSPYR